VAPGNAEVLTLVGNLHLSLCDWAPAQSVFDQLLAQKVPNVEAYSMLSLGNIYFNNLKTPTKYSKHLHHAADYYKRILSKDKANAYAANGLGTVLAEKGELAKAKACFDRVREVSGDTIPDTLLNLGHIYLAQKKHPEALQMYQSYMGRTQNTGAPITSKSQDDDDAQVLLYIAFAYFDWARQTELFNDARAAPADGRYKMCISYIEKAMKKSRKENVTLRYNWCMAKLQAANCVLQKLTRNIRRTAKEVQDALIGLEESLPVVQTIIQWKNEGKKIDIRTNMLNDFVSHCQANIESARSHLSEELKKEAESKELRELQRLEAETQQKEREMEALMQKEREAKELEDREKKAKQKMDKVSALNDTWKQQAAAKAASSTKGDKKGAGDAPPGVLEEEDEGNVDNATAALFDDDSDEDDSGDDGKLLASERREKKKAEANESAKKDDDDDVLFDDGDGQPETTEKDLFGESSDEESDEELTRVEKRPNEDSPSGPDAKKRRVVEEE
jgi:tetratricopeptide (TPR) repeat protein